MGHGKIQTKRLFIFWGKKENDLHFFTPSLNDDLIEQMFCFKFSYLATLAPPLSHREKLTLKTKLASQEFYSILFYSILTLI